MAFKFQDLMVNVLPGAGAAAAKGAAQCPVPSVTQHCPVPSMVHCPAPSAQPACAAPSAIQQPLCPFPSINTQCPFPSMNEEMACPSPSVTTQGQAMAFNCPFPSVTTQGPPTADQTAQLDALRTQLKDHLAKVDAHEEHLKAGGLPKTSAEAEDLKKKMTGAMGELDTHIANLKKQGK